MLRPHTRRRIAASAATAVVALLVLSGCYRVEMAVTIHENDTVDGSAIIAVDQSVLSMTGSTIDDVIPDDTMEDSTVEPYTEGTLVGKKFTFESTPISEFGSDDEGDSMTIEHVGDTYVMDGTLNLSSGDPEQDASLSGGTIKMSFTFPGEVIEADGEINAETNTVTWTPTDMSVPLVMHAVGKDSAGGAIAPWMLLAGGAALLVVIGAVVAIIVVSVRRSRRSAAPVDAQYVPQPGTPYYAPMGGTPGQVPPPGFQAPPQGVQPPQGPQQP